MQQENFDHGIVNSNMSHPLLNKDDMLFLEIISEMFKTELDNILASIQFFKHQSLNFNDPYYSEKKGLIVNLMGVNFSSNIELLNNLKNKLDTLFECRNYHKRIQNATVNVSNKFVGLISTFENIFWPHQNFQVPSYSEEPIGFQVDNDDRLEAAHRDSFVLTNSCKNESDADLGHVKFSQVRMTNKPESNDEIIKQSDSCKLANQSKRLRCKLCDKHFNNHNNLIAHLKIHSGDTKPFKCNVCDKKFNQRSNFNVHCRTHLRDNKPFKCTICDKDFNQKQTLENHVRIHTGEKPFKCKFCDKSFSSKSSLNLHTKCHENNKPFKCDICSRMFMRHGHLKYHIKTHNNDKQFKCNKCNKDFITKSHLKIHYRIHTGEKLFKCEVCSKGFNQLGNYRAHCRIHSGIKPYKCNECSKEFSLKHNFNRHYLIHTGEKNFKCIKCERGFVTKAHLNYHLKSAHSIEINENSLT